MTFLELRDYLKTKISGWSKIKVVYKAQKANLEGFPAVCISPSESSSDFETTKENLREYVFDIRIYQEMEKIEDEETVDDILSEAVDEIIDALEKDYTLGGKVLKSQIKTAPWGWEEREQGLMRVANLKLYCYKLVEI